jgi:hypothetical protein
MNPTGLQRTKRLQSVEADGIEELIARRRDEFVSKRRETTALRMRADELESQAASLARRCEYRRKKDCFAQAHFLRKEAARRESMHEEFHFEQQVVAYLKTYYSLAQYSSQAKKASQVNCGITDLKASLMNEFVTSYGDVPPKVVMSARDECPKCNGKQLLYCTTQSIMTCPSCGYSMTYLDATCASLAFDDAVDLSSYSYKKINHYTMHLALCQAKETHRVPSEVLQTVMKDLHERQGIRTPESIHYRHVREALRRNRIRKAYDYVVQITSRIKGVPPPRVTASVEAQLKNMFLQMQPVFLRHAPNTRTNFLSYTYVLYRCFQILGQTHMLDTIVLLKGRSKLEANDAIFRRMCEDLEWSVHDLPPA